MNYKNGLVFVFFLLLLISINYIVEKYDPFHTYNTHVTPTILTVILIGIGLSNYYYRKNKKK